MVAMTRQVGAAIAIGIASIAAGISPGLAATPSQGCLDANAGLLNQTLDIPEATELAFFSKTFRAGERLVFEVTLTLGGAGRFIAVTDFDAYELIIEHNTGPAPDNVIVEYRVPADGEREFMLELTSIGEPAEAVFTVTCLASG